jgi:anti-sigma factor ChrR (cupin superfamily)
MEPRTVYIPEIEWRELTEFPGKGQIKMLRDEGPSKAKSMLIRLHAGGEITPHAHVTTVQHYILEGEYESEGQIYGAGTYRLLPGHANVSPISTANGVTMLMIYDSVG